MSSADTVWKRARSAKLIAKAREGDRALFDVLRFHQRASEGGPLSSFDLLSYAEVSRAIDGFRFFGLEKQAELIEQVRHQLIEVGWTGPLAEFENIEQESKAQYQAAHNDFEIASQFKKKFEESPESFAPVKTRAKAS